MTGTIRISSDELLNLINQLRARLNAASQKRDQLFSQRDQYTRMMGEGDSSAAVMVNMIEQEIEVIKKMIDVLEAAILMLQEVMKGLDTYVSETASTLQGAVSALETSISKGISAAKLG